MSKEFTKFKHKIFSLLKKRPKLILLIVLITIVFYIGIIVTELIYIPLSLPPEVINPEIVIRENLFQQIISQMEKYDEVKAEALGKSYPDPFR